MIRVSLSLDRDPHEGVYFLIAFTGAISALHGASWLRILGVTSTEDAKSEVEPLAGIEPAYAGLQNQPTGRRLQGHCLTLHGWW